jgi:hypothetical protein
VDFTASPATRFPCSPFDDRGYPPASSLLRVATQISAAAEASAPVPTSHHRLLLAQARQDIPDMVVNRKFSASYAKEKYIQSCFSWAAFSTGRTVMEDCTNNSDQGKRYPQLTEEQAREICHKYLIEALRLIPFKDRIRVFAAAMKDLLEIERKGGGRFD